MSAKSSSTNPRAQIWWLAVFMTPWCWVMGTVILMARQGESFPRAAALATVSAIGGLIMWAVYHAISGRNDGFAAFIVAFVLVIVPDRHGASPLSHELAGYVARLVPMVLLHCILGLFLRSRPKAIPQPAASPLWDSDVDPPPR